MHCFQRLSWPGSGSALKHGKVIVVERLSEPFMAQII